jgi:hypothetical protein
VVYSQDEGGFPRGEVGLECCPVYLLFHHNNNAISAAFSVKTGNVSIPAAWAGVVRGGGVVPRVGPGYAAGWGLGSQAVRVSNLQAQEPADDELLVETVGRVGAGNKTRRPST